MAVVYCCTIDSYIITCVVQVFQHSSTSLIANGMLSVIWQSHSITIVRLIYSVIIRDSL